MRRAHNPRVRIVFRVLVAVVIVTLVGGSFALVASQPPAVSLTHAQAVGEWKATEGTGSLTLFDDGSFTVASLSIDPLRRAAPLGEFTGSGTWVLGAVGSSHGALTLRFTDWANTRLETKPPELHAQLYPVRAERSEGVIRLYFEDASEETRFYLER
jgi:hypothetical protein